MSSPTSIKTIAIVGATGNLGKFVTNALLSTKKFAITAISRSGSESTLPTDSSVTIKQGDYSSAAFLADAFTGIEAVVFCLHHTSVPDLEIKLIDGAAAAGVKWILPTEFGHDSGNAELTRVGIVNAKKAGPRKRIEELAEKYPELKWIGIINNPWFDFAMKRNMFLIDPKNKTANFLSGGTAKFNTTMMSTTALAIARLLSLPVVSNGGAALSDYGNKFVYISSFRVSQRDILDSVQRATGSSDADWTITHTDVQDFIDEGPAKLAKGDMTAVLNLLIGSLAKEGLGGDYESTKGLSNAVLDLPKENLDETVKALL
ncbi:NAD(P)-binding protein [Cadophora sp. DSE1049]|nr:NAD(P)-binding protein [Cadophora sp. DSE1049]